MFFILILFFLLLQNRTLRSRFCCCFWHTTSRRRICSRSFTTKKTFLSRCGTTFFNSARSQFRLSFNHRWTHWLPFHNRCFIFRRLFIQFILISCSLWICRSTFCVLCRILLRTRKKMVTISLFSSDFWWKRSRLFLFVHQAISPCWSRNSNDCARFWFTSWTFRLPCKNSSHHFHFVHGF